MHNLTLKLPVIFRLVFYQKNCEISNTLLYFYLTFFYVMILRHFSVNFMHIFYSVVNGALHSTTALVTMPFKHKSGSRKGQEKKEQEEKAAKLPKLDYFGFLTSPSTSRQPTEG